jgi:nucleoside-diphosphate-sugar epimerase
VGRSRRELDRRAHAAAARTTGRRRRGRGPPPAHHARRGRPRRRARRAGIVYGPGGLVERALLLDRARVIGWGGNYLSCVHVDDAARAVAAAVEHGASGTTYLAADDEPMTQRALADAMADAAGRPRPGTASVGVAGARVGFPLARSLVASQRVRNARAKAELGWAPRFPTVRDGVCADRRR